MKVTDPTGSHERIAMAIPALIRGTLPHSERELVRKHLSHCTVCSARYREDRELAGMLSAPPRAVEDLLSSQRLRHNRENLLRRIAQTPPAQQNDRRWLRVLPQRWLPRRQATALVAALASVTLVAVLVVTDTGPERTQTPGIYQTRSATGGEGTAIPRESYRLVFHPDTTPAEIKRTLQALNARVVGDPTAAGVYTVTIEDHASSREALLSRLREHPGILLAEKSLDLGR